MKNFKIISLISLISTVTAATIEANRQDTVVKGSYIVMLKPNLRSSLDSHLEVVKELFTDRNTQNSIRHVYKALGGKSYAATFTDQVKESVSRLPEVEKVYEDRVVNADKVQLDAPWGLSRISQRKSAIQYNVTQNIYNYTYTGEGEGVSVYVIDSGIKLDHPEFEGRAVFGKNLVTNSTNNEDQNGHGTHVAGTVGSKTFGVAKKVDLIAVKVLSPSGSGKFSDFIAGVDWAVNDKRGVKGNIITMSLGGFKFDPMNVAVEAAFQKGFVITVSAGNTASDSCERSPASSPNAITVGSIEYRDFKAGSSCFGPCVDIFAPGDNIKSTYNTESTKLLSGTSMATPHVAGQAAIILSTYPNLTNLQVIEKIKESATKDAIKYVGEGSPNLLLYNSL